MQRSDRANASTPAEQSMRGQPVVALRHLDYRHADGRRLPLDVPLTVFPGQAVAVTGPSGAGKTTLLRALAGCPPEGAEARFAADRLPERPVLFLQDPEAQLLCAGVEEEVELGPRNQGLTGPALERRVADALAAMDIAALRERDNQTLSMGQKHRVALAALLAMEPDLLLLDEPFSQLDAPGEARLRGLLARLKTAGRTIIVTTHAVAPQDALWDIRLDLSRNDCANLCPRLPQPANGQRTASEAPPVLQAVDLGFRRESGAEIFAAADLAVERGMTVQLDGDNASGKSTLLRCLAGLLPPNEGQVLLDGAPAPKPGRLAGRLAYLPQQADMLLFEESVRREVGFTLRRQRLAAAERQARVEETLGLCGLQALAHRAPLSLSHGERHMLALASLLAARPAVLLLDEPLTGLDAPVGTIVLGLLDHFARAHGTAVLLATHGALPSTWGDRRYVLAKGRLHAAA